MDVGLRGEVDGIQAARMMQEHSHVPIIFLTGHRDSETLQRAVLTGPMGYLIKPFQEDELRCAIEVAIHKHRAELAVREREEALRRNAELLQTLSLIDELTQLRNRRGFFELAQQALKVAQREHYAMGVFFMDLNGLKRINDSLGHQAGDQALRDTAEVLRDTFRSSDILARIGGDEFVAMAHVHSTQDLHALSGRLRDHLQAFNQDAPSSVPAEHQCRHDAGRHSHRRRPGIAAGARRRRHVRRETRRLHARRLIRTARFAPRLS